MCMLALCFPVREGGGGPWSHRDFFADVDGITDPDCTKTAVAVFIKSPPWDPGWVIPRVNPPLFCSVSAKKRAKWVYNSTKIRRSSQSPAKYKGRLVNRYEWQCRNCNIALQCPCSRKKTRGGRWSRTDYFGLRRSQGPTDQEKRLIRKCKVVVKIIQFNQFSQENISLKLCPCVWPPYYDNTTFQKDWSFWITMKFTFDVLLPYSNTILVWS